MTGPEATIERKCVKLAHERGWRVYKVKFLNRNGAPDRLFVTHEKAVLIEFKAPGKLPTLPQQDLHEELRDAGLEVWVIDSVAEFKRGMGWNDSE